MIKDKRKTPTKTDFFLKNKKRTRMRTPRKYKPGIKKKEKKNNHGTAIYSETE